MSEKLSLQQEFEQKTPREIERKFIPKNPENLVHFFEKSRPIEQFYLSSPNEEFSLRLREEVNNKNEFVYTATLKDRGFKSEEGLNRIEIETEISSELYNYYKKPELPCLKKLRANITDNVIVDFYEDGTIQVESEDQTYWNEVCEYYGEFEEVTDKLILSNEFRANQNHLLNYENISNIDKNTELHPEDIVCKILSKVSKNKNATVRICGRSGSGKSTITNKVKQTLDSIGISSVIISTDDYNRGKSWLDNYNNGEDWSQWDHPLVYDTKSVARDIEKLQSGETVQRRCFDFVTQEPTTNGELNPASVIIIEGIYAISPDFEDLDALKYEIPTPLATCIGRRILRDMSGERPAFLNPSDNLKYILEQAEPMYRGKY